MRCYIGRAGRTAAGPRTRTDPRSSFSHHSWEECLPLPALPEPHSVWTEFRAALRRIAGDAEFEIWLSPLELRSWDGDVLLIQAPAATQAWVSKRFGNMLRACLQTIVGEWARVEFAGHHAPTGKSAAGVGGAPRPAATTLNPRYSFTQFIIGDGNRLAHAAALSVAELPGQALNPLFLYAPPGLGKTHLLHAIGNYVLGFGDGATVRYTTVEAFTNHFVAALSSRTLESFKHAYRDADVLLIDDVQFLAKKVKTEEEFFHTFNALYEDGRQLVITCDRLPAKLHGIAERLRERFGSGLVAEIKAPDLATRMAILKKRVELDHVPLENEEVLELIADHVRDNVRALEGTLIRLVAHHSLTGRKIDSGLAREVLRTTAVQAPAAISLTSIQAQVAGHFGITTTELVSQSRRVRVAWPRQVAIYLARELTQGPLGEIGEAFGGRNHATVIHACKRVAKELEHSPEAKTDLQHLTAALSQAPPDRPC